MKDLSPESHHFFRMERRKQFILHKTSISLLSDDTKIVDLFQKTSFSQKQPPFPDQVLFVAKVNSGVPSHINIQSSSFSSSPPTKLYGRSHHTGPQIRNALRETVEKRLLKTKITVNKMQGRHSAA